MTTATDERTSTPSTRSSRSLPVALVEMPFGDYSTPSLAAGLLKAIGQRAGHTVAVLPFGLRFALRYAGLSTYKTALDRSGLGLGEWVFSEAVFGRFRARRTRDPDYLTYLRRQGESDEVVAAATRLRSAAEPFLDDCLKAVDWSRYEVVGFTTTCVELNACLALGRRLKRAHPHVRLAYGGAKCDGEMGRQLFESFPWVDFVFSGEADLSFPELLDDLAGGGRAPIAGVYRRDRPDAIEAFRPAPMVDLDSLPTPDYSDFVRSYAELGAEPMAAPSIKVEGSRGCWWGEKSTCTFCGLNGSTMAFRNKHPTRLLDEILELVDRYHIFKIDFTDNIIDHRYLKTLFPKLEELGVTLNIFIEAKANLRREQLATLRRAGVCRMQAGVESLDTHVLALMKKGVTGIQNVRLLKLAEQLGIHLSWNLLYNFPGEQKRDYESVLKTVEAIAHLRPPQAHGPIALERFSPYYVQATLEEQRREAPASTRDEPGEASEQGGVVPRIRLLGPQEHYRHTMDLDDEVLRRLAYGFDYVIEPPPALEQETRALEAALERWRRFHRPGALVYFRGRDCLRIEDRRFNRSARILTLGKREKAIYLACEDISTPERIVRDLSTGTSGFACSEGEVRAFLDALATETLVLKEANRYLALAIPWTSPREAPAFRRQGAGGAEGNPGPAAEIREVAFRG